MSSVSLEDEEVEREVRVVDEEAVVPARLEGHPRSRVLEDEPLALGG